MSEQLPSPPALPAEEQPKLTLPEIALSELPEATKDFILASTLDGTPSKAAIVSILTDAAHRGGFPRHDAA